MPISQEKIQEHTSLLNTLNSLDYVPSASQDNDARLLVINREIDSRQRSVEALGKKTKSEFKDLSRAKSTTRQWFLRIRQGEGAVSQKLEKEQQEYLDAFRAERDARDELAMLMGEKSERERAKMDLAKKAVQIPELKAKIEELYEGLFAGPTPDYPEEEMAESKLKAIETQYHRTQTYLNKYTTAITLLIKAEKTIRTCTGKIKEAQAATARLTVDDTLANMSEQLVQCSSLLSGRLTASMAQNLIRQADEACGGNTGAVVGALDMVPNIPRTTEWDGVEFVTALDDEFPAKLEECLRRLGEAGMRLQGEIDKTSARINDYQNSVRQLATKLQNCRKELAETRFRIMMSLTDPAALALQSHTTTARNAHEVGDPDLPAYSDSKSTVPAKPTAGLNVNISGGAPSYEESQAHISPVGGFRVALPIANTNNGATPASPSSPAPGGGIGGFRVQAGPSWAATHSLAVRTERLSPMPSPMPSPQLSPSKSPTVSLPLSTLSPPGSSVPRPISWSLNPYASAMIRRASMDDEVPLPPGGWMDDSQSNPFGKPHTNGH